MVISNTAFKVPLAPRCLPVQTDQKLSFNQKKSFVQDENTFIDTENKWVVAGMEGYGGQIGERIKKYKSPVMK